MRKFETPLTWKEGPTTPVLLLLEDIWHVEVGCHIVPLQTIQALIRLQSMNITGGLEENTHTRSGDGTHRSAHQWIRPPEHHTVLAEST